MVESLFHILTTASKDIPHATPRVTGVHVCALLRAWRFRSLSLSTSHKESPVLLSQTPL